MKYWIELHEQYWECESEDAARERFKGFLGWLSTLELRTKPSEIFSNPQLDEYITIIADDNSSR